MGTNFSRFWKRLGKTQEVEIDCSACLDQVSTYVDLELATGQAEARLPQVKQHLDQCGVCFDEYQTLRQLATLEMEDELPSAEELQARLKGSEK